jgi:hypothetical protein
VDRRDRLQVPQRHGRQDRDLQHGGAAARQDRRLHRLEEVETSKIDEKLKDANAQIRLDTFIDPALVRKVQGIVQDMLREKGFQFATVTPEIQEIRAVPKLSTSRSTWTKGRRSKSAASISSATRRLRRQAEEAAEETPRTTPASKILVISGRGFPAHSPIARTRSEVRRGRREAGRRSIASTATSGERRRAGTEGRVDFGDKKTRYIELKIPVTEGDATRSAASMSPATRSSRPTT